MKKFDFKLQKLLDIRYNKEEESKLNFSKAQDDKTNAEENLDKLNMNYSKYSETRMHGNVVQQKTTQFYLNSLATCIDEAISELEKKKMILEEKRQDLKQKQVDRKTVDILKDKQMDKYTKEVNAIEQRNNDEFALYGYIRNTAERG
ncbi:flagellar export protein FliJ [Clostridium akagii]|uniref:flagellar export protein FliJ n=1 Tax=Clostridium akagii TaxID=91623 RepID=UPI00047C552D|nr:flagellar export protein FliJ [Clostridium akagii]